MPLVDKILTATIKYLQKKQRSLRRNNKKRKTLDRRKKPKVSRKPKPRRAVLPKPKIKQKAIKARPLPAKPPREKDLGSVTHYFSRIEVVVIKLAKAGLKVGDTIHIKGRTTDFTQKVKSLQIESVDVAFAKKGDLVGLKVVKPAKEGDRVYGVGQN